MEDVGIDRIRASEGSESNAVAVGKCGEHVDGEGEKKYSVSDRCFVLLGWFRCGYKFLAALKANRGACVCRYYHRIGDDSG